MNWKRKCRYTIIKLQRGLMSGRYRIIRNMLYLPDKKLRIDSLDYVRSATLELMAREINGRGIKGSIAEVGVFKGDFAMQMNCCFPKRGLYLFDTFEGFDDRDLNSDVQGGYSSGKRGFVDTSIEEVLSKMPYRKNCIVRKGYFPDTAVGLEDEVFAFVSLDADLYEPIYQGLRWFYRRLSAGGMIFVHDYNNKIYRGSKAAVDKFCIENCVYPVCIPDICGTAIIVKQ